MSLQPADTFMRQSMLEMRFMLHHQYLTVAKILYLDNLNQAVQCICAAIFSENISKN